MKKFLLVWLISLFWFISFSNAYDLTSEADIAKWKSFNFPSWVSSVKCISDTWRWQISYVWIDGADWFSCPSTISLNWRSPSWIYVPSSSTSAIRIQYIYDSNTLSFDQYWWFFWSLVGNISTVLWEFIPYVIYIWLWVLIVSIAFVAVKWLMLWIYNKVRFIFKKR